VGWERHDATMAGAFFAGAVYRYSKGGQFEQLLYGGFAS